MNPFLGGEPAQAESYVPDSAHRSEAAPPADAESIKGGRKRGDHSQDQFRALERKGASGRGVTAVLRRFNEFSRRREVRSRWDKAKVGGVGANPK